MLIINLFKILLTITISAQALQLNQDPIKDDKSIILNKGKQSPFMGVLVPEYQYRIMSGQLKEKDTCYMELQSCVASKEESSGKTESFIYGLGVGALSVFLYREIRGK